jgi:hypothetical protein
MQPPPARPRSAAAAAKAAGATAAGQLGDDEPQQQQAKGAQGGTKAKPAAGRTSGSGSGSRGAVPEAWQALVQQQRRQLAELALQQHRQQADLLQRLLQEEVARALFKERSKTGPKLQQLKSQVELLEDASQQVCRGCAARLCCTAWPGCKPLAPEPAALPLPCPC